MGRAPARHAGLVGLPVARLDHGLSPGAAVGGVAVRAPLPGRGGNHRPHADRDHPARRAALHRRDGHQLWRSPLSTGTRGRGRAGAGGIPRRRAPAVARRPGRAARPLAGDACAARPRGRRMGAAAYGAERRLPVGGPRGRLAGGVRATSQQLPLQRVAQVAGARAARGTRVPRGDRPGGGARAPAVPVRPVPRALGWAARVGRLRGPLPRVPRGGAAGARRRRTPARVRAAARRTGGGVLVRHRRRARDVELRPRPHERARLADWEVRRGYEGGPSTPSTRSATRTKSRSRCR